MYQYRVFNELGKALRRLLFALLALVAFFVGTELLRLLTLVHAVHPYAAWAFAGLAAVFGLLALQRILRCLIARHALRPPALPSVSRSRHKDLVRHCRHLAAVFRRLAVSDYLDEDRRRLAAQAAYDIDDLLGAHPLLDDMARCIDKARSDLLPRLYAHLDAEAEAMSREKMTAVVADVMQPPFPVAQAVVVLYHQVTLVTSIVGVYLSRPCLADYGLVLRDVWRVMTIGDFVRVGQSLFAGVYANCPPLGRAIEELGQGFTCCWLTRCVSLATMHRCRSLTRWSAQEAIADMDARCLDALASTRDTLIRDLLPLFKISLHHHVPRGTDETAGFHASLLQGITKAVDGVIQGLRTRPPLETIQNSRRTSHGDQLAQPEPPPERQGRRRRSRRSGSSSNANSVTRVFRTLSQRIKYTVRGPGPAP